MASQAMNVDMTLDELLEVKRAERRKNGASRGGARGRGARGGARGGGPTRGSQVATTEVVVATNGAVGPVRNKYSGNIATGRAGVQTIASPAAVVPLMADGAKIIVSNLPQDVTENQVRVCPIQPYPE